MSILVLAEHNNKELKSSTLSAITAAGEIDENIEVLVIGSDCEEVSNKLKNVKLVKKIISVDNSQYINPIAELISPIILSLSENYTHIIAPASTFGKNIIPRVAVLLDVAQVSDIIQIKSPDTFIRPIYAGNALATVQSTDVKKIITIRPTSFEPASTEGGSAEIEQLDFNGDKSNTEFLNRDEKKLNQIDLN